MKGVSYSLFLLLFFVQSSVLNAQDLNIYGISPWSTDDEEDFGFIALTDGFPYSDHYDSLVISDKYLGNLELESVGDNLHKLDQVYRKRVLQRLNINESDDLFIYHLLDDTVFTIKVSDLELLAFLTPYEPQIPIRDYDYYIGFQLMESQIPRNILDDCHLDLITIGVNNPFQTGELKRMIWKKMKTENFESFHDVKNLPIGIDSLKMSTIYKCELGNLVYYLMNYSKPSHSDFRHLIIVHALSREMVYNSVLHEEGDHELISLNIRLENNETFTYQWTGALFKNKSPVFFNFTEPWFGCPSIYFIDEQMSKLEIKCDNRH